MVEYLPPGNVLQRARFGRWSDIELLLHQMESRLREVITQQSNLNRARGTAAREPEYMPLPETPESSEMRKARLEYEAQMEQELRDM